MQDAGGDDGVEALLQLGGTLDRELMHFEIVERVFPFQFLRECDARRADVDADDAGARPAHGIMRRLHRAAAGKQYTSVFPVGFGGPEEMRFGAPASIVPISPIRLQVVDGWRVWMTLIKVTHPLGLPTVRRRGRSVVNHERREPS